MTPSQDTQRPDTSPEFFERLYRQQHDPWNFRRSPYERARYQSIVSALGSRRYQRALEPGCAIGELTALLAPHCATLQAFDCSATAVAAARRRCREFPWVTVTQGRLSTDARMNTYDLIVLSEIGYYFTAPELEELITTLQNHLLPGGDLLACHWLGQSDDHVLHGHQVHEIINRVMDGCLTPRQTDNRYKIQRWSKSSQ